MQMFHVKRSEPPPHGGGVRDVSSRSPERRNSAVDPHTPSLQLHDDPNVESTNQCDVDQVDQRDDPHERRRRQSWAEKAILFYQYGISPLKPGPSCRFEPTCSNYALTAIRRYGVLRGVLMAAIRLSKCGPWHPGGWDPVPPRRTPRERVHDAHVHDDKDHREGTTDTAGGRNNRQ